MPSVCDSCFVPGYCCRKLDLSNADGYLSTWADQGHAGARRLMIECDLPFEPIHVTSTSVDEEGREWVTWRWSCPKLQPDGRCGIYEQRPLTCRSFEAGTDPLCVHYKGCESGDASAPLEFR